MATLALVILAVRDLARAKAFYRAAFDWKLEVEVPPYAEFRLPGGLRVGLYVQEGFARNVNEAPVLAPEGRVGATELYLYSDDPARQLARLVEAGARELAALAPRDWGDTVGYVADLDGNVLAIARTPAAG